MIFGSDASFVSRALHRRLTVDPALLLLLRLLVLVLLWSTLCSRPKLLELVKSTDRLFRDGRGINIEASAVMANASKLLHVLAPSCSLACSSLKCKTIPTN